jgi:hypothetical protein
MTVVASLEGAYHIMDGSAGWPLLAIAEAVADRIRANYTRLGLTDPDQVLLGDIDPRYLDLPMIGVCPLAEGQDTIAVHDYPGEIGHSFSVSLYGAYKDLDAKRFDDAMPRYAGRIEDLFSNRIEPWNASIDGRAHGGPEAVGEVVSMTTEIGSIQTADFWIRVWIVKLNITGEF